MNWESNSLVGLGEETGERRAWRKWPRGRVDVTWLYPYPSFLYLAHLCMDTASAWAPQHRSPLLSAVSLNRYLDVMVIKSTNNWALDLSKASFSINSGQKFLWKKIEEASSSTRRCLSAGRAVIVGVKFAANNGYFKILGPVRGLCCDPRSSKKGWTSYGKDPSLFQCVGTQVGSPSDSQVSDLISSGTDELYSFHRNMVLLAGHAWT